MPKDARAWSLSDTPLRGMRWSRLVLRPAACVVAACMAAALGMGAWAQSNTDSFFEFGTVVALGKHDVDVQTFDPQRQRLIQRSFGLGKGTQADVVHVGDAVEVIYTVGGQAGSGSAWTLLRLIAIHGEVPKAGPAGSGLAVDVAPGAKAASNPASSSPVASPPAVPAPAPAPVVSAVAKAPPAVVPARKPVSTGRASKSNPAPAVPARNTVATTALSTSAAGKGASGSQPVALGGSAGKAVPSIVSAPLGVSANEAGAHAPKLKGVAQEAPGQQCGREADWPSQPISMAVLDFRYPTEHEEANDVSKTGGGSGTAIADLVYNQLAADQPELQMRRGDREKLFRMDFAGAARLGRQLGVDLVLLGTFAPVDVVSPDPAYPNATQAYTLRAGVVETCTGQLLYKLTSITCPAPPAGGPPPAKGTIQPSCPGSEISVKDTVNPLESAGAYRQPIEQLLGPLLHNTTPAGVIGSAGVVTATSGPTVTIRIGPQGVRAGQQVSIHSFRLAKNPTTNTLQRFQDTEIGRMTITKVNGGSATGTYQGDIAPKVGDTAEIITE